MLAQFMGTYARTVTNPTENPSLAYSGYRPLKLLGDRTCFFRPIAPTCGTGRIAGDVAGVSLRLRIESDGQSFQLYTGHYHQNKGELKCTLPIHDCHVISRILVSNRNEWVTIEALHRVEGNWTIVPGAPYRFNFNVEIASVSGPCNKAICNSYPRPLNCKIRTSGGWQEVVTDEVLIKSYTKYIGNVYFISFQSTTKTLFKMAEDSISGYKEIGDDYTDAPSTSYLPSLCPMTLVEEHTANVVSCAGEVMTVINYPFQIVSTGKTLNMNCTREYQLCDVATVMWRKWFFFCICNICFVTTFYAAYVTLKGHMKHIIALINTLIGWTGARMNTLVFDTKDCIAYCFATNFTTVEYNIAHGLSSASHLLAPHVMPMKFHRRKVFKRSSTTNMFVVVFLLSIISGSEAQQVSLF